MVGGGGESSAEIHNLIVGVLLRLSLSIRGNARDGVQRVDIAQNLQALADQTLWSNRCVNET